MGFGDSVTALLDTYANCLKLLKAFNGGKADRDRAGEARLLRSSIKSDRAKIHRAYSSRRSVAGSRFEKGDREPPRPARQTGPRTGADQSRQVRPDRRSAACSSV